MSKEKLTGKAREDFEAWNIKTNWKAYNKNREYKMTLNELMQLKHHVWEMEEQYINALLVSWLDNANIKIYVLPTMWEDEWIGQIFGHKHPKINMETRQEALSELIKKANDIYNSIVNIDK